GRLRPRPIWPTRHGRHSLAKSAIRFTAQRRIARTQRRTSSPSGRVTQRRDPAPSGGRDPPHRALARVVSIDVPVPEHLGALAFDIGPGRDPEPGDRALPALVIAVEQVDHYALAALRGLP